MGRPKSGFEPTVDCVSSLHAKHPRAMPCDLVVYRVEDVPNQSIFVDESDTSESLAAFDAGQGRNQAAKCRRQIADRPARIHRSSVMHTALLTLAPGPRSL